MDQRQFHRRLITQALLHKRGKALLIILAVAMGSSVITALLNLDYDLRSRMNKELRDYGPNVLLLPSTRMTEQYIDQTTFDSLQKEFPKYGILEAAPEVILPIRIQGLRTMLTGTHLKALKNLYPGWIWSESSAKLPGLIFLGSALARKIRVQAGDTISVEFNSHNYPFRVAGTIRTGEAEDDQAFCELADAERIHASGDVFHLIALSALGTIPEVENRLSSLARSHPEVRFQILRKIAYAETLILDKISRLMALVITVIIAILFFCIHTTVSAILIARQREIALLRVLGAKRRQIMGNLSLELMILALAGGFLGFFLGLLMAQILGKLLFQTYISPHWIVFVITILSSLALMIISSIAPIRRAINQQAALVLKEV
jgi:putative ABC transport system permease protein